MAKTELATNKGQTDLKDYFEERIADIAKAMPKHLSKERQVALLVNMVYRNPQLAQCDKGSILASAIQAGSLGLDLSPSLGEAYLIPRWNSKAGCNECQFQPGYQGLVKLVKQTGQVKNIQSRIVYKDDEFVLEYNPDLVFIHRPAFNGKQRAKDHSDVRLVYCVAKLANDEMIVEYMSVEEIEAIRQRSKSANGGPWVTDWNEMAKKTPLRRLMKMLPKSTELSVALEAHDSDYDFENGGGNGRLKIDNQTGYGSGKYAPPEQVSSYLEAVEKYLDERNQAWLDRWDKDGEIPDGIKDLATRTQVDQHILKWAIDTGRVDPKIDANDLKYAQVGRFTAIPWHASRGDQNAMKRQLRDFLDEQESRQTEALRAKRPELFEPEDFGDEPTDEPIEAEVVVPPEPVAAVANGPSKLPGVKPKKSLFEQLPREPGSDD